MKITTNNVPRNLVCFHDLPDTAQSDFDYVSGDDLYSPRFFSYRGAWYDTNEFMRFDYANAFSGPQFAKWDGYQSETFFSGIVVRYVDDFERVIVGLYFS